MDRSDAVNQEYLLNEQYKDASNFSARVQAVQGLNTQALDWYPWIFKLMKETPNLCVLELGCGPGYLWLQNLERIAPGWDVTLSDLSPGMIAAAQNTLSQSKQPFTFQVIDAQDIPHEDASFDIVIAHLMLYHVPDLPRAFAEIRRVLKPGGTFYTSSISQAFLVSLGKIMSVAGMDTWENMLSFSLENGAEELAPWFSHTETQRLSTPLVFPSAEPLLTFIRASTPQSRYSADAFRHLQAFIQQEIARNGEIRLNVDMGAFIAS